MVKAKNDSFIGAADPIRKIDGIATSESSRILRRIEENPHLPLFFGDTNSLRPFEDNTDHNLVPTSAPTRRSYPRMDSSTHGPRRTMDVLAALFFVIAGVWLVVAIMYTGVVLLFLKMRARGRLEEIYEEEWGRVYLFRTRFYIPFGCLLRRYIRHLHNEASRAAPAENDESPPRQVRYMTRSERHAAMEQLLVNGDPYDLPEYPLPLRNENGEVRGYASAEDEAPTCSICLGVYELGDLVLRSKTCSHVFHQDCLLQWLERPDCVECPCCRVPMVSEDDVWAQVKAVRRKRRQQRRSKSKDEHQQQNDEDLDPTSRDEDSDTEGDGDIEVRIVESATDSESDDTAPTNSSRAIPSGGPSEDEDSDT